MPKIDAVSEVQRRIASSTVITPVSRTQCASSQEGWLASMIWPTWAPESARPIATVGFRIISRTASRLWFRKAKYTHIRPSVSMARSMKASTGFTPRRVACAASERAGSLA